MASDKKLRTQPKQSRAEVTADIIIQAAIHAIESAEEIEAVTSQNLAVKSGFSVGSLYRYFKNKDDLYTSLWRFFVTRLHAGLVPKIDAFPNHGTVRQLMMMISEYYFDNLRSRRPGKIIPLYRLFIKAMPDPENVYKVMDVLIAPLMRAQTRNQSGTMKIMDEDEVRICLRASQAMIRNDFMERNPYFGTSSHERTVLDLLVRIYQK
ncbi:TetR/AcrR family transcriptional regulator [Polynucleobacter sp. AM-7D1]|uniref:TetR/AcrR family transcriptional regulator n=1 Tax=Polynucleobacter sp. AM-7D1 TaxID=2689102 RepID=UPI001BFEB42A|nr:TetR/AcrR family transcriptional regulator [Polynucleobacter sp. AM-7D1]QWE28712.1 helix-turn-helix transcriptional regulator [Polynucleobacter sp. AM-7D1]